MMAFVFYRKMNRKGGVDAAGLYALFMAAIWLGFAVLCGLHLFAVLRGSPFSKLFQAPRIVLDLEALVLMVACTVVMHGLLHTSNELGTPEEIRRRYDGLSFRRKSLILVVVLGTPLIFALT